MLNTSEPAASIAPWKSGAAGAAAVAERVASAAARISAGIITMIRRMMNCNGNMSIEYRGLWGECGDFRPRHPYGVALGTSLRLARCVPKITVLRFGNSPHRPNGTHRADPP